MTMPEIKKAVERLLNIMATLRSPNGCPWDAEQTPESLKPYILEETYEVLEAIDSGIPEAICEELGDLLLQVVFLARIFEEQGAFDLGDVAKVIADKLVRRHPHVFGDQPPSDIKSLNAQWDRIKFSEKREKGESTMALGGVPRDLPALLRARKLGEKACRSGFSDIDSVDFFGEIRDGLDKLEQATKEGNQQAVETELGDILFAIVNFGRLEHVDAEEALRSTLNRFILRFEQVERSMGGNDSALQGPTIGNMDARREETTKLG